VGQFVRRIVPVCIVTVAVLIYGKLTEPPASPALPAVADPEPPEAAPDAPARTSETGGAGEADAVFHCDGRTYCSQMSSCAEARYFLRHCPNVKMDGDHDAVPCESQWCPGG